MEWILEGYMTKDIIDQCLRRFEIDERQAYKYIKKAKAIFKEASEDDIKERLAFHIAARMKLFNGMEEKKSPRGTKAALAVLIDIASLEGYYVNKTDVTSGGQQIHSQVIEATLTLK